MIKEWPAPAITAVDHRSYADLGLRPRRASSEFVSQAGPTALVVLLTVLFLAGTTTIGLLLMGSAVSAAERGLMPEQVASDGPDGDIALIYAQDQIDRLTTNDDQ